MQDPHTPGTATWAASIRNNLTNALAAVANSKFLTLPVGAQEDRLTPLPTRTSTRRRRVHDMEWQEETMEDEKTKVHYIEKDISLGEGDEGCIVPTLAYNESEDIDLSRQTSTLNGYNAAELPHHLPSIAPLSRGISIASDSSGEEKIRIGAAKALENIRERAVSRATRPELRVRTLSILSRGSSEDGEERFTDDERRAQRMLLERRKRNMANPFSPISPGRGRGSGSTRSSMKSTHRGATSKLSYKA
jgi:hypothetical protein